MSINTDLPLNLYKANLELQLRMARIMQESCKKWMELGARGVGETITDYNTELEQLLKAQDWQSLAALPADTFWRRLQQRFNDSQSATQTAVGMQTAFAAGVQDALQSWQKETMQAFSGVTDIGSINNAFNDIAKQWSQMWPVNAVTESKPSKAASAK